MKHNYDIELLPMHLWRTKEADPYKILYHFFDYTSLEMCRQLMKQWFTAAFEEDYAWKDAPANLLHFYERFEVLVYGCWLLCNKKINNTKQQQKPSWFEVSALSQHRAERIEVFKFLNAHELYKPLSVLEAFFNSRDLYTWRCELHNWLEAGLGRQTITEMNDAGNVLPVMERLNKLAEAAYVIHQINTGELSRRGKKSANGEAVKRRLKRHALKG